MTPSYLNNQYLLTKKAKAKELNIGDCLAVRTKKYGLIIKRLKEIDMINRVIYLEGDNKKSITKEQIGAISLDEDIYKVIKKLWREND